MMGILTALSMVLPPWMWSRSFSGHAGQDNGDEDGEGDANIAHCRYTFTATRQIWIGEWQDSR